MLLDTTTTAKRLLLLALATTAARGDDSSADATACLLCDDLSDKECLSALELKLDELNDNERLVAENAEFTTVCTTDITAVGTVQSSVGSECLDALDDYYSTLNDKTKLTSLTSICSSGYFDDLQTLVLLTTSVSASYAPECSWVDDDGCGEYTDVDACIGSFVVDCVECSGYPVKVGGDIADFSIWAGREDATTFTIEYESCNAANSCDSLTRYVTVADTTPPTLNYLGDYMDIMEASDYGPYEIGSKCTDECTALTSNDGATHGPNGEDIEAEPAFLVVPKSYDEFLALNQDDTLSFVDNEQYYCETSDNDDVMLTTAATAETNQDSNLLAATCGVYEVSYSCIDMAGNYAAASQFVAVIDTTAPEICIGYCAVRYKYKSTKYLGSFTLAAGAAFFMSRRRSKLARHKEHDLLYVV